MTPVKNCIKRKECCKSKYRQISIIMNEEAEKMEQFMETEEGKKIFSQRARTVEAPYGTLKKEINIETCAVIGNEKRENIIDGITS